MKPDDKLYFHTTNSLETPLVDFGFNNFAFKNLKQ